MRRIKPVITCRVKPSLAYFCEYSNGAMKQCDPPEKILADNLNRLMAGHISLNSEAKVAKLGGVSQRTVNRARNALQIRLESLRGLAKAFGLSPWQLLVPNLDPENPPLLSLSPEEKALYERLRTAAKSLL